jgi:hypothetical protein
VQKVIFFAEIALFFAPMEKYRQRGISQDNHGLYFCVINFNIQRRPSVRLQQALKGGLKHLKMNYEHDKVVFI